MFPRDSPQAVFPVSFESVVHPNKKEDSGRFPPGGNESTRKWARGGTRDTQVNFAS